MEEFLERDPKKGHIILGTLHVRRREARVHKGFTLCLLTDGLFREYDWKKKMGRPL